MKLPINVVLESLMPYSACLIDDADSEAKLSGVQILTSSEDELKEDMLYVCSAKILEKLKKQQLENNYFVFRRREPKHKALHGITLGEETNINEVVNLLISLFFKFNSFEFSVKEASLSRQGYEPFFEVARKAFPHCLILVTDSAYNIMASTRKSVEDKPYFDNLLRRGFYSREEMDQIAGHGYYDDERKCSEPVLYPPDVTCCGYPFLVRSYRNNGTAYCFMGCYFLDAPPTQMDIALYSCLTNEIDTYFRNNGIYESGMLSTRQQLVDDLIHPKQNTHEYFRDRCAKLGIPSDCEMRLGIVRTDSNSVFKLSLIANRMNAHCPIANYGAFLCESSVILLLKDWNDVKTQSSFREDWDSLLTTLRQCGAQMGVSLLVSDASKLAVAYSQALAAIELGRKYEPMCEAFLYSKYCIEDMLRNYACVMPLEDTYTPYIDKLLEDNNGACSNVKILYYYLSTERNISMTAKYVHMHRNSVIYRIQKIHDMLNLDLDDPNVRLRLQLSMKMLEMLGRIPHWDTPCSENKSVLSME